MNFNDAKRDKMQTVLGVVGNQHNDLELLYVQLLGASASIVAEGWQQVWDIALIPPGQFNDRADQWLASLGFSEGTTHESWLAYWLAPIPTPPP